MIIITHAWLAGKDRRKVKVNMAGSIKQLGCVLAGFWLSKVLPQDKFIVDNLGIYCLMLLIFIVGVQLRSNDIPLRQVLINHRGIEVAILTIFSALLGGLLFAAIIQEVSWSKGLASGLGWYSLSGIVMTEAYGPIWGSVALLNDLAREFFALAFIPILMRRTLSAAIGGATSLDFTLPIIQNSGGLKVVPFAISFGFIINVLSPILMVCFFNMNF